MTNKLCSMFFLAALFAGSVCAQSGGNDFTSRLSVGVLAGLNIPKLTGSDANELSRDYTSRTGEAFGITASYTLGGPWAIRADLLYSSEGGKRNGFQAFPNTDPNTQAQLPLLYATFDNESILNYLELPVMAKYSIPIANGSKLYFNAGPYVGYLLKATQKTSGASIIYADRTQQMPLTAEPVSFQAQNNIKSQLNKWNVGITGGIGLLYPAGPGHLMFDIRGAYGLTTIQKDTQNNGKSHIGNILVALGYTLPL